MRLKSQLSSMSGSIDSGSVSNPVTLTKSGPGGMLTVVTQEHTNKELGNSGGIVRFVTRTVMYK
ncbi:hypothetical protein DPMN_169042 [Dreissena polymorpha]|uniref:Uncharacterized protein n=1 Tax=Dreissena polymorpha TaxID=45954 RepID=A0A9D4IZY2_DREPO|nr:hypothetical protein DPMN_169042 [Dreissena polymorpha]